MKFLFVVLLVSVCKFGYAIQEFEKWKNDLSRFENKISPMEMNLVNSARSGSLAEVKLMLGNDTNNINAIYNGSTALLNAVEQGHYEVVKYLLSKGADINLGGAVYKNHSEYNCFKLARFQRVWEKSEYYNITPLMLAVMKNDKKMVTLLLTGGPDLTIKAISSGGEKTVYNFIVERKIWEVAVSLLKIRKSRSSADAKVIEDLVIKNRSEEDKIIFKALNSAAAGRNGLLSNLLSAADPKDIDLTSLLMTAIGRRWSADKKNVDTLLSYKVDPNKKGWFDKVYCSPLSLAIRIQNKNAVIALLKAGAVIGPEEEKMCVHTTKDILKIIAREQLRMKKKGNSVKQRIKNLVSKLR